MHLVLDEMTLAEIEAEGAYTPRLLQQLCVDGLIVHHAKVIARGVQDMIRAQGIPAVWLHQCDEVDAVYPDDELAVHDCTTALLAAGHTRIAYLTFHPDTERRGYSSDLDRLAGYRSAMTAAGLEPQVMRRPHDNQVLYAGESSRDQRIAAARDLLKAQRPTAVLTRSTQELVPLLMAASELGIAVGSELLVITVEERLFSHAGVPVTTLVQPMHAIGAAAVEMLLAKIDAPDQPQPSRAIPYGGPRGAPLLGPPS
jgi:LacI family transcriptional regulator